MKCSCCELVCYDWSNDIGYITYPYYICSLCAHTISIIYSNNISSIEDFKYIIGKEVFYNFSKKGDGLGNHYEKEINLLKEIVKLYEPVLNGHALAGLKELPEGISPIGATLPWKGRALHVARLNLAEEIIKHAAPQGAYPYGGYVRDKVANTDFKDLDLYFPKKIKGLKPNLDFLSKNRFDVQLINYTDNYIFNDTRIHSKYRSLQFGRLKYRVFDRYTKVYVDVDCVQSESDDEELDHGFIHLDVDINNLGIINGKIVTIVKGYDVEELKQKIKNRTFSTVDPNIKQQRIDKLVKIGYTCISKTMEKLKEEIIPHGEKVKVEIHGQEYIATYVAKTQSKHDVLLITQEDLNRIKLNNSCFPYTAEAYFSESAEVIKKNLNLANKYVWHVGSELTYTKIKELIRKAKMANTKTPKKIEIGALTPGDRVTLIIDDNGTITNVHATFVRKRSTGSAQSGVFALDTEFKSGDYASSSWDGENKTEATKLGIDTVKVSLWEVDANQDEETLVTEFVKEKEKKKMSNTGDAVGGFAGFQALVAQDARKGAIRTGATVGIKGVRAGLKKLLANRGMQGTKADGVMEFFESDIGEALLRAALGYGLNYLPIDKIQQNEYAQALSEELRVSGMTKGMDVGMEMVTTFILPAVMEAFQNSPIAAELGMAEEKTRVVTPPVSKKEVEEEEEEEDVKAPAKTMKA